MNRVSSRHRGYFLGSGGSEERLRPFFLFISGLEDNMHRHGEGQVASIDDCGSSEKPRMVACKLRTRTTITPLGTLK